MGFRWNFRSSYTSRADGRKFKHLNLMKTLLTLYHLSNKSWKRLNVKKRVSANLVPELWIHSGRVLFSITFVSAGWGNNQLNRYFIGTKIASGQGAMRVMQLDQTKITSSSAQLCIKLTSATQRKKRIRFSM